MKCIIALHDRCLGIEQLKMNILLCVQKYDDGMILMRSEEEEQRVSSIAEALCLKLCGVIVSR